MLGCTNGAVTAGPILRGVTVLTSLARTLCVLGQSVYTHSLVQKEAFFYPPAGFACVLQCLCRTFRRKHEPAFSILVQDFGEKPIHDPPQRFSITMGQTLQLVNWRCFPLPVTGRDKDKTPALKHFRSAEVPQSELRSVSSIFPPKLSPGSKLSTGCFT